MYRRRRCRRRTGIDVRCRIDRDRDGRHVDRQPSPISTACTSPHRCHRNCRLASSASRSTASSTTPDETEALVEAIADLA